MSGIHQMLMASHGAAAPAGPFGGLVSTTDMVDWWPLDEASGNALGAHAGLTLTDNGTVTATTGPDGSGARQFTAATTEFFSRVDEAALRVADHDFLFHAFIYVDSLAADRRIISKRANGTTSLEYDFYVNTAGTLSWIIANSAGTQKSASSAVGAISTATWYQVVAYHDSVNDLVGVQINNGTPSTSATAGIVPFGNTSTFMVGQLQQVSRPFSGRMQRVGFWKRLLTGTEVGNLYNSGNGLGY